MGAADHSMRLEDDLLLTACVLPATHIGASVHKLAKPPPLSPMSSGTLKSNLMLPVT